MSVDPIRQLIEMSQGLHRYQLPTMYQLDEQPTVDITALRSPLTPPPRPTTGQLVDGLLSAWRGGSYGT